MTEVDRGSHDLEAEFVGDRFQRRPRGGSRGGGHVRLIEKIGLVEPEYIFHVGMRLQKGSQPRGVEAAVFQAMGTNSMA